ncbi:hypothetical protein [Streptomyces sp. NPDC014006]|uniref:hypothetical protein n=1 Tax=Streptomyces sp. NPDC014006 TaxID=3364870 RepID=UPI0036FC89A0
MLAATGPKDRTHLITADPTAVTAHYGMPHGQHDEGPRDPFASWISTIPAGRLLCTTGEYGLYNYCILFDNIVSITDQPLTATSKPALRALASVEAEPFKHTEADLREDVLFHGKPVGMDHRPRPSLIEHLTELERTARKWDWDGAKCMRRGSQGVAIIGLVAAVRGACITPSPSASPARAEHFPAPLD